MKQRGPAMTKSHVMPDKVHLVGSIGLDTAEEVFRTVGKVLGRRIRRVPDGEPGGRRMWISWQYPLLRASPFLKVDREADRVKSTLVPTLCLGDGVKPGDIRFSELGYAREARESGENCRPMYVSRFACRHRSPSLIHFVRQEM